MKTRSNVSIALSFLQAGRGCCGDFFLDWEVDQVHFVITV